MADSGAAVAAIIANAIKASGTVVSITPSEFVKIVKKVDAPLVIYTLGGFLSKNHQYLTSYKGFAFHTKSSEQIDLPRNTEVVVADKIWIPG